MKGKSSLLKTIKVVKFGVLVGTKDNNPLVLTMTNKLLMLTKGKAVEIDDLMTITGIDLSEAPILYGTIKLYRVVFPVILLVSYYLGLMEAL